MHWILLSYTYGSTTHFGAAPLNQMFPLPVSKPGRIEGRLSSRPIKSDVFSDVSAAGVKTRRIMIQLPTLELSCKIVGRLSSCPIKSEFCQQYAGESNLDLTLRPHLWAFLF